MSAKNFLLALLLLNVNTILYAQNSMPDFSGTWRLNLEKSKLPKGTKVQSQTIAITRSGESIQMRYTTDGKESTEAYTADGKERTVNENQGGKVVVKAKWKGPTLLIERIARLSLPSDPLFNGSEVIHDKERWKLSADGRILTAEQDEPRRVSIYEKMPI